MQKRMSFVREAKVKLTSNLFGAQLKNSATQKIFGRRAARLLT